MIQAIIFDMDGLIIDSEGNQSVSYEKVLREQGVEPKFNDTGVIQTVVVRAIDNWKRLKTEHNLAPSVEELLKRKSEIYKAMLKENITLMPGFLELIANLRGRKIKQALASSSTRDAIDIVIDNLGLRDYFEAVVSGEDVKAGKPAPDIFLEAARLIGAVPASTVVLEDAGEGVIAAKAAGMKVIAVPNRYTRTHDFDKTDLVVSSLEKLDWDVIKNL